MRLIDADSLPYDEFLNHRIVMWEDIERSKTIDAVQVVRCKDCKYYNGEYEDCAYDIFAKPNGYCSYGERMEEQG